MGSQLIHCSVLFLLVLAGGHGGDAIPSDYSWDEETGYWFKYHASPATWDQARLRCQAEGAILASPHNEQQKAAILSLLIQKESLDDEIFTGVHAIFSEGDYSSIEGVPLLRLAVTWARGEPDNVLDSERCLSMKTGQNGTMADTRCNRALAYVCYKKDKDSTASANGTEYDYEWNEQTGNWTKYPAEDGAWYATDESKPKEFRFDYEWNEEAGGWFKYQVIPTSHKMAKKRCEAEGAVLASPSNMTLKTALMYFILTKQGSMGSSIYTGVKETDSIASNTMTAFGKTANIEPYENIVLPYVCYKEDTEMTMTDCGTTDPEYVFEPRTGSCYKFHNSGVVWSEGYMTCVAEGGYLAIINNETEAEVIRQILAKQSNETFYTFYGFYLTAVGVYDWGHLGKTFSTIHGEPLEAIYNTWHAGEPNNPPNTLTDDLGEYCGTVERDGELYDYACNVPTAFICEKNPNSLLKTQYI